MHYSQESLATLDSRFRAHLINSLSGFKSANLIGTQDSQSQTNLAIVSSVFHLGAHPPFVGMIIRPHSVARHTFENILETKVYTINQVNADIVSQAHQTSARYDKEESEFTMTGLTPETLAEFKAPFVAQSHLKYAVQFREHQHLAINGTELVIGEIIDLHVKDGAIQEDGFIDLEALNTVTVSGLDSYHTTQAIERLPYAKKDNYLG
ncbi:flavin reductase [Reinekea forsetii]|nr:flavin reductase [Reinekea forsetii]